MCQQDGKQSQTELAMDRPQGDDAHGMQSLVTCTDFWPFKLMAGSKRLSSKSTKYRVSSTETKGHFCHLQITFDEHT